MDTGTIILVGGMPATGKTTYAKHLSSHLKIPLLCKDSIKETIWDRIHYNSTNRDESVKFGMLAYDLAYQFCETLMNANTSFVFESNFTEQSSSILSELIDKYKYTAVTVLLDADIHVVHERFIARDDTNERHQGLVSKTYYDDFDYFAPIALKCREFSVGKARIVVDTTDFSKISYDEITKEVLKVIDN